MKLYFYNYFVIPDLKPIRLIIKQFISYSNIYKPNENKYHKMNICL